MPEHAKYLWWNGKIVTWEEAKVHVTILGWSTMGAVFEGIKAFWNEDEKELVDGLLTASDEDALRTARRLAKEEGIFGGFSTGANVACALELARTAPTGSLVVTLAPDTGLKYLSTDLVE